MGYRVGKEPGIERSISSLERMHRLLSSGIQYSTAELCSTIGIQANTAVKNAKFLRDRGEPLKRESRYAETAHGTVEYSVWWYERQGEKPRANDSFTLSCWSCGRSDFFWTQLQTNRHHYRCECGAINRK